MGEEGKDMKEPAPLASDAQVGGSAGAHDYVARSRDRN